MRTRSAPRLVRATILLANVRMVRARLTCRCVTRFVYGAFGRRACQVGVVVRDRGRDGRDGSHIFAHARGRSRTQRAHFFERPATGHVCAFLF